MLLMGFMDQRSLNENESGDIMYLDFASGLDFILKRELFLNIK